MSLFAVSLAHADGQPGANISTNDRLDAKQSEVWFENYRFRNYETLDRLRVHYATLGSPHRGPDGEIDNAVLVLHWTGSGGSAVLTPDYKSALYAPGRPLDASRYFLIFPDNVGHGQSSKPSDGLKARFPKYGYGDIVDVQHRLVTETLGVKRLHAILGISMGGMNAWQWAEAWPETVEGIMPVVSMPVRVSGRNMIWRRLVIDSIRSDPDWRNGDYDKPPQGWLRGYALLRMMIDNVTRLQSVAPDEKGANEFIADVKALAAKGDANDLMYSLQSSSDYDPEPGLGGISAKVFSLNFADDEFNPAELGVLERLTPRLKHGRYVVQPGTQQSFGHLTMAHPALWAQHVEQFMCWLEQGQSSENSRCL